MDPELVARTEGITIFSSDDDNERIQKSVDEIKDTVKGVNCREFHLKHFTYGSMGTDKFPELLEVCTN